MWLIRTKASKLLTDSKVTMAELAQEFGISEAELSRILDGKAEAVQELAGLFISAFGADEMERAIDWRRTTA